MDAISYIREDAIGGFLINQYSTPTSMYTQDFLQPDAGTFTGPIYINNIVLDGFYGLDNGGTTFIAGNTLLEFTVGETASITLNNANQILTQGILQPYQALCPAILVITPAYLPLKGSYAASQEIQISGALSINPGDNVTFSAPVSKVQTPNRLTSGSGSNIIIKPDGCLQ